MSHAWNEIRVQTKASDAPSELDAAVAAATGDLPAEIGTQIEAARDAAKAMLLTVASDVQRVIVVLAGYYNPAAKLAEGDRNGFVSATVATDPAAWDS